MYTAEQLRCRGSIHLVAEDRYHFHILFLETIVKQRQAGIAERYFKKAGTTVLIMACGWSFDTVTAHQGELLTQGIYQYLLL